MLGKALMVGLGSVALLASGCAEDEPKNRRGSSGSGDGTVAGDHLRPADGWDPGDSPPPGDLPNPCSNVEALGAWAGTFAGDLTATTTSATDVYATTGTLSLAITCGDEKILVSGEIAGQGCVDSDCADYTADIVGEYLTATNAIDADMVNGIVDYQGAIQVPFIGTLDGTYASETLTGTWAGEGQVEPFATITGEGTWEASRP